jgi:RimJ/RimL family protein N-acetyltransferase
VLFLHFDTTMLILPFIFLNHPKHLFEVGWMIARKYWGCRFATEAGQAAIAYAFEELQRSHIISLIRPANLASRRVAEKLGEKLVGSTEVSGNEAVIYKITQEEWLMNQVESSL